MIRFANINECRVHFALAVASALSLPAAASGGPVLLHAHDSRRNLFTVDVESGVAHLLSRTPEEFYDIAFDQNGRLFGLDSGGHLRTIDPETGVTSLIGTLSQTPNSLVFGQDGTLWAAGGFGNLRSIDPTNGQSQIVMSFSPFQAAGDLAFDPFGRLLVTTRESELLRLNLGAQPPDYDVVGDLGFNNVYGFARGPDDVMYGLTSSNRLLTIDPLTGRVLQSRTLTADFPIGQTQGTSFTTEVPEPASLILLAAGALFTLRRAGRKNDTHV